MPHAEALLNALRTKRVAKDSSDTGTGKTPVACYVAEQLKLKRIVVVCPKSVIPTWRRWFRETGYAVEEAGAVKDSPWVQVINYESLRTGKHAALARKGKRMRWNLPKDSMVIFDEDHKLKGRMTLNSKMCYAAKHAKVYIMLLGATSFSTPLEMDAMGFAMDLHKGYRSFVEWLVSKCGCRKDRFNAWVFPPKGREKILTAIKNYIYPRYGSRMSTTEIEEFPENHIIVDSYGVKNPEAVARAYAEIESHWDELQARKETDGDNALTEILRARQEIELAKVQPMFELARSDYHGGYSVALFVNFRGTQDALVEMCYKIDPNIAVINGDQSVDDRRLQIEAFQENKVPLICATIGSGGVGIDLHDVKGGHPRTAIISPSFSAIELRQALGRIHRAGSHSKAVQRIVFAADTVEERVCLRLKQKLSALDTINDSDLSPFSA